jgi:hypothetical protein
MSVETRTWDMKYGKENLGGIRKRKRRKGKRKTRLSLCPAEDEQVSCPALLLASDEQLDFIINYEQ